MRLDDFAYELPVDRIAQTPIEPRDSARLLVDRGSMPAEHRLVSDLPDLLRPGDLLVVNESRVIPARLRTRRRTGGAAEVLLLEALDDEKHHWEALVRPARRLKDGEVLTTSDGAPAVRIGPRTAAGDTFEVELLAADPLEYLDRRGEMPLPPYITTHLERPERYQTVYATEPGSAAAPTAGLHFTPELLGSLADAGIERASVELLVGLDTFAPVTEDDPTRHVMHTERYRVPTETWKRCQDADRVVAVGTTAVRALESAATRNALSGRTDLFIHRGYQWNVVDVLMTNFHMPHTTLLMMVDAFVGDRWRTLYQTALAGEYRFLSFGDAMLLDPEGELMIPVEYTPDAVDGSARTGLATTARGEYITPCFMPVGTRGAIRYLTAADYDRLGVQIVLGNTYHLMLRPGADVVAGFGGLAKFTGWDGLTLTDSGGFQVFSLDPKVDDDGVTFKSTYDGSLHRFTPEGAVATQELLGADIQMVLDVCPPLPSEPDVIRLAVERTAAWATRAKTAHCRTDQALFGIVQGGISASMRAESAKRTVEIGFDGYGIGGLSVGEHRDEMLPALAAAMEHLPEDRPRYLMGVGDPVGLVESIALGVDQFDCVMQTRLGRHGTALTGEGKVHVKAARYRHDEGPLDADCPCEVCARHSRGYIRHLFSVGEASASRLVSLHNIAWTFHLMAQIRDAIVAGTFDQLRRHVLSVWE